MKSIFKSFKDFNWHLWCALSISLLIPAIYSTIRINYLGDLPNEWGVNIASQLSWVSLLYEIMEEALILPLFYVFGKSITSKKEIENKTKSIIVLAGSIFLVLSILMYIFAKPLCIFMASDLSTLNETVEYIKLESIGLFINIIYKIFITLFVSIGKDNKMYILIISQAILSIIFDSIFFSNLPISLHLGVNGIAYTNMIVKTLLIIISLMMLYNENIRIFNSDKISFLWIKEYLIIGFYSGLESFVRNIAYILMVSKMVNTISEQGTYWIANNFIWTWLLIPANAMYDVIKKETAEDANNIMTKTKGYFSVSTVFSMLWFASIPLWKPFIHVVLNVSEYQTVFNIVLIQSSFYIIYIYNCILDGTIYGRGKTNYMLIESIFTNLTFYTAMYVLYRNGLWIPTLKSISIMFGVGMAIDLLPTIYCYRLLKRKINYSNPNK